MNDFTINNNLDEKNIKDLTNIEDDEQLKNNTLYIYNDDIFLNKVYENYPIKINDFILNFLTEYIQKNSTKQQVDNNKYKDYFPINQYKEVPVLELKIDNNLNIKKKFWIDDNGLTIYNLFEPPQNIVNKFLSNAINSLRKNKEEIEAMKEKETQTVVSTLNTNDKEYRDDKVINGINDKQIYGGKYRRKSRVQKKTKTAKKSKKAVKKTARRRK